MKTTELIDMLATGVEPVDRRAPLRRAALALAGATGLSALIMAWHFGVNPDLVADARRAMFWIKAGFALALTVLAVPLVLRLATPGRALGSLPAMIAAPVIALWVLAAFVTATAAPAERGTLLFGETWEECPWNIALLALPVFAGALWAMRGFAPTQLRRAGAGAGLLAGASGASVYALHCPEYAAPFLAVWYVLGILLPVAAGALIGPRVLRW